MASNATFNNGKFIESDQWVFQKSMKIMKKEKRVPFNVIQIKPRPRILQPSSLDTWVKNLNKNSANYCWVKPVIIVV